MADNNLHLKDPAAEIDFEADWTAWLADDNIVTATWTVTPAGALTIDSSSNTAKVARVWVSGGEAGKSCDLTSRIVTEGGRTDERSLRIHVTDR